MLITLTNKTKIRQLAQKSPLVEICGFLVFDGENQLVIECKNKALDPEQSFLIDPKDFLRAKRAGQIIASYHSQHELNKCESFSVPDKLNSEGHKLFPMVLYLIHKDIFEEYMPNGYKSPYIGRVFAWGEQDCLSLTIEYYKNELGIDIKLPSYADRDELLTEHSKENGSFSANSEFYLENSFTKIKDGPPILADLKLNDLLLIKCFNSDIPSHIGIYMGNGRILHHTRSSLSKITELNKETLERTVFVARHQKFI